MGSAGAWVDGPVVGFDTETTGVDVGTDRIVTAAVVRREGITTSVTSWLIDPGVPIPDGAAAIHGITTGHARLHGRAPGGALEEIASTLAAALLRGEPVVAFNASFDLSLLDAELARHGLPTLPQRVAREVRVVLDPLVMDRGLDRYRRGKRRLGDLCAHYGVVGEGDLHSADVDVLATLDVLRKLTERFPQLREMDLDSLHDRQVLEHRRWADSFNHWRRERGLDGPGADTTWPARRLEPLTAAERVPA